MSFQPAGRGTCRVDLQQSLAQPRLEIETDRTQIADDLRGGLFKREVQGGLAAAARGLGEVARQARFPGPRAAGHQNAAAPKVALAPEHPVEIRNASRESAGRDTVL